MTDDLPITPGSHLDHALDLLARMAVEGGTDTAPCDVCGTLLVDVRNPAHMLALGTRVRIRMEGVEDPRVLVADLWDQWYGRPIP